MTLTPEEIRIVDELGFDQNVAAIVRANSRTPLERLERTTLDGTEPAPGLSVTVSAGKEAEKIWNAITPQLEPYGYRAFWSNRHDSSGMKLSDELAILKTNDPYAIIRLRNSDGANYGITTEDILDRLSSWQQICTFTVVDADHDWVAIQFIKLPEKICAFAEEVYLLCHDSVGQGVGLSRERDDPQRFKDARALCPEITIKPASPEELEDAMKVPAPEQSDQFRKLFLLAAQHSTPTDMGIRLLALELKKTNYLFLWWD
jgi:hypothetical protein